MISDKRLNCLFEMRRDGMMRIGVNEWVHVWFDYPPFRPRSPRVTEDPALPAPRCESGGIKETLLIKSGSPIRYFFPSPLLIRVSTFLFFFRVENACWSCIFFFNFPVVQEKIESLNLALERASHPCNSERRVHLCPF